MGSPTLFSIQEFAVSFIRGVNGYIYTVEAETSFQWFWSEQRGGRKEKQRQFL